MMIQLSFNFDGSSTIYRRNIYYSDKDGLKLINLLDKKGVCCEEKNLATKKDLESLSSKYKNK